MRMASTVTPTSKSGGRRERMNQDPRHFVQELDALKHRLFTMAGLVEERLQTAIEGLVARDAGLLRAVISGDGRINILHMEIDDRCFTLTALQQPVAVDLRAILSALKINADLERVGDLAVNIAEAALQYLPHPPVKPLIDLPRMGDLALAMLRRAIEAFATKDVAAAHAVLQQDDLLDALNSQIFRELLTYMLGNPATVEPAVNLILICRHLERVGDHATNIAEDVIFIVEARDVRHGNVRPDVERRRRDLL
jgi:phosphate transport system protein